jgi:hypothetical protein
MIQYCVPCVQIRRKDGLQLDMEVPSWSTPPGTSIRFEATGLSWLVLRVYVLSSFQSQETVKKGTTVTTPSRKRDSFSLSGKKGACRP